jgi:hypothetical protein
MTSVAEWCRVGVSVISRASSRVAPTHDAKGKVK